MANEWEPFRDEIIVLYLVDGLTLNEVSSKMIQLHGFDKRKHQYEYMLKKWRIGKNTKKEMWEYVDHKVQKRQRQQKESEVRLHGIVLSDSRVRKAMQRYGRRSLAAKYLRAPSPQTPDNTIIDVRSPPRLANQQNWPESVPWTQFGRRLPIVSFQLPAPLIESMIRALATCNMKTEFKTWYERDQAILAALSQPLNWQAVVNSTRPKFSESMQESATSPKSTPECITATQIFKNLLFQMSNKNVNVKHPLLAQNMMKLIHGLQQEATAALDHLLTSTDPTSAAVRETFFAVAVYFGQSSLVAKFLAAGTNPNILIDLGVHVTTSLRRGKAGLILHQACFSSTALQFACGACDISTASVLLEYQARPDFGNPTPLQILCSSTPSPDGLELAKMLLQRGVQLETPRDHEWLSPLMGAVSRGNTDLVRILLNQGVATQDVFYCYSIAIDTLYPSHLYFEFPKDGDAYIETYGARLNLYEPFMSVSALQMAIMVNDANIIQMLLPATRGSENEAGLCRRGLVTACLTADESLVCQLLDLSPELRTDNEWINAAFCAAAWSPDCKIARLLLEHQLIPRWQEGLCVSAGQIAALHGNHGLLKMLHSCGFDINASGNVLFSQETTSIWRRQSLEHPQPLAWQPLECAIRLKHTQAAHTLLQLGATVSDSALKLAFVSGTEKLVLDMLARDTTFLGQSPGLLQAAIQEGKGLAVIRKLVDVGVTLRGDELVAAVKTNASDVFEYLLSFGLDLLASNIKGETVLDAAACSGNLDMMHIYFNCGGHYNSKALLWAVIRAIATSETGTVEFLIENRPGGPMDVYEATGFVQSILQNQSDLSDLFLNLAANTGTSYFCWHEDDRHLAVEKPFKSEWTIFRSMEICDRDQCHNKISPLWAAAHMHRDTLLENMINRRFHPDAFVLKSALYNSTFANKEIREKLATAYPISSITDKAVCRRLLVEAIFSKAGPKLIREHINSVDCLEFISYNECGKGDGTPLQLAAMNHNIDCVKALLDAGAAVNAPALSTSRYYQSRTALQHAVHYGDYEMTMLLLEKGADVNASTTWGYSFTAIEMAAWHGRIDMTALLLLHATLHGHLRIHLIRAVSFAEKGGHQAIVELLKKHGGWTYEDSELLTTNRASDKRHTCPRYLYDDASWDGTCYICYRPVASETSATSTPTCSQEDENSVLSIADMIEIDNESVYSEPGSPGVDSTMLLHSFEDLDYDAMETFEELDLPSMEPLDESGNGTVEVDETSFCPYDFTTTWLDDFPEGYFDSLI